MELELPAEIKVAASDALVDGIEGLLGRGSVRFAA